MAVDKLVDSAQLESDLTDIADAIRAKTGGTADLQFPSEFLSEIGSISGGGGLSFDDLASGDAPNGDVRLSVTKIINSGMAGIQNNVHTWRVIAPNVKTIEATAFRQSRKLTEIHLPVVTTSSGIQHFYYTSELRILDYGLVGSIPNGDFQSSKLDTLILRKKSVVSLPNTTTFNGTAFASNGTGGTLYVPSDLIASYEVATNWSTILGYTNNSIQAIEGSIYETPLS